MRIAQVAPLTEAVPPRLYGGTERVVHWLTEELVALGNDVTLFASGDSETSAKLEATWPKALRLAGFVRDPNAVHMGMLGLGRGKRGPAGIRRPRRHLRRHGRRRYGSTVPSATPTRCTW